jgi:hypothetical protein
MEWPRRKWMRGDVRKNTREREREYINKETKLKEDKIFTFRSINIRVAM